MKLKSLLAALAVLGACGSDVNDAEPRLIPGGGLGDGAIAGKINVFVIDGDTNEPIGSATVLIGEPGEGATEGLTDTSGLFTLEDDSLGGPTTVTVTASGYSASTWFGANGANITIPLSPDSASSVPQAELAGTIAGWDALPEPATNHLLVGAVAYSQTPFLGDPANDIAQPPPIASVPANACVKITGFSQCDWRLNSRVGQVAVYALILDVDTKGTPTDDSDDTFELIGFAYKESVTVEDGVNQSGISLEPLPVGALTDSTITLQPALSGLTTELVIYQLDTGATGLLNVVFAGNDDIGTATVPKLEGVFADASYRVIALTNDGTDVPDNKASGIIRRVSDIASIDMGEWMSLPTGVSASGGTYSFEPVGVAAVHVANFRDTQGNGRWSAVLLDDRTSFSLPGLSPSSLPSGEVAFSVSAWEGSIDVRDFEVEGLFDQISRLSTERITFTN